MNYKNLFLIILFNIALCSSSSIRGYVTDSKNKEPILTKSDKKVTESNHNDDMVVEEIKKVLDTKIRPAVEKDGGDITFVSFKDGTVKVELKY